jgi:regulator of protease activity HflC (stomatin/prohibitin superfamily)
LDVNDDAILQEAWVVERMGKFHGILDPGLKLLIPILDEIK